jgi:hypothetical protein
VLGGRHVPSLVNREFYSDTVGQINVYSHENHKRVVHGMRYRLDFTI